MGPGFRYHVATIVAVFMALGIGMIIGSSFLQEALVERLRLQLSQLNERFTNEIQPLRKESEDKGKAIAALSSRITQKALDKSRVAIVVTGDYADLVPDMSDALRAAGGTVQSITKIAPSLSVRLDTSQAEIAGVIRRWRSGASEGNEALFQTLATAIARGGSAGVLRSLVSLKLIETQGDYRRAVNAVVLVGGGRDTADRRWETVDYPLIDQLSELGVVLVGAEPSVAVQSYMPAYQAKGLSTVDNVDTAVGRTALVFLVSGESGSYGIKETARDGLIPPGATEP